MKRDVGPRGQATTGGFCCFLSAQNQSCDDACAADARGYDPATASYAGSGGSDANCEAVATDLGFPGTATAFPGSACGCRVSLATIRDADPTTSSCALPIGYRAGACQSVGRSAERAASCWRRGAAAPRRGWAWTT